MFFPYLVPIFFKSFLLTELFIEFAKEFISLIGGIGGSNILGGPHRNPCNCTIWDKWVFENFILADEPLQKLCEFLKLAYQLIIIFVEN